jgi:drug/metabolite transporter (DMT)-like permease
VAGDIYMIAATIVWSFYSWMLTQPGVPIGIRSNWAAFLLAQVTFGVFWSSAFSSGEWLVTTPQIIWSWPLAAALVFVSLGPAIIAFRCWGAGVQRAGPTVAGFFSNLTPPVYRFNIHCIFRRNAPLLPSIGIFSDHRRHYCVIKTLSSFKKRIGVKSLVY